jgi:hypothetical protein
LSVIGQQHRLGQLHRTSNNSGNHRAHYKGLHQGICRNKLDITHIESFHTHNDNSMSHEVLPIRVHQDHPVIEHNQDDRMLHE